ncbi:MAG: hypothetical protein CMF62_03245 [Magnetococcales bacterium]|nr:hypothetical protein [Magnetococcales bacterium]|tara:strand:- start:1273 stop:2085 length:813 start_codon:yes stop_codon:yes gene_type:complete
MSQLTNVTSLKKVSNDTISSFYQYRCPISNLFFHDPVIASDGKTYEREIIEEYVTKKTRSPVTNEYFKSVELYSNDLMKELVEIMLNKFPILRESQYKPDELKLLKLIIRKRQFHKINSLKKISTKKLLCENHLLMKNFLENCNSFDIFKLFIDKLDDLEARDKFERKIIYYVVRLCPNEEFSLYLINDKKVNIEFEDNDGWRLIHQASLTGSYKLIKYLIDIGININCKIKKYGRHDGGHSVVRFLLKNNNLKDYQKEELIRLVISKEI